MWLATSKGGKMQWGRMFCVSWNYFISEGTQDKQRSNTTFEGIYEKKA